ncbi:hypothetical protein [Mesobacillus foraminis]|uniref:hypothetical protein n=1 Tax=Mesobacillus foraminis TaxID=279826 RepID=UPI0010455002|nr:hypothetical protein [Mesobacillus foraminis]
MNKKNRLALRVSLFVLVGFPLIFLFVSFLTGNWNFLIYSLPSAFAAGFPGFMVAVQQMKQERNNA